MPAVDVVPAGASMIARCKLPRLRAAAVWRTALSSSDAGEKAVYPMALKRADGGAGNEHQILITIATIVGMGVVTTYQCTHLGDVCPHERTVM